MFTVCEKRISLRQVLLLKALESSHVGAILLASACQLGLALAHELIILESAPSSNAHCNNVFPRPFRLKTKDTHTSVTNKLVEFLAQGWPNLALHSRALLIESTPRPSLQEIKQHAIAL